MLFVCTFQNAVYIYSVQQLPSELLYSMNEHLLFNCHHKNKVLGLLDQQTTRLQVTA